MRLCKRILCGTAALRRYAATGARALHCCASTRARSLVGCAAWHGGTACALQRGRLQQRALPVGHNADDERHTPAVCAVAARRQDADGLQGTLPSANHLLQLTDCAWQLALCERSGNAGLRPVATITADVELRERDNKQVLFVRGTGDNLDALVDLPVIMARSALFAAALQHRAYS